MTALWYKTTVAHNTLVVDQGDVQDAAAQVQGGLDGVGDTAPLARAGDKAIDDDLNQMLATMIDVRRLFDVV